MGGRGGVSADPFRQFMDAYEPARQARDWATQVESAIVLADAAATAVLGAIGVPVPEVSVVRRVDLAKVEAPAHQSVFNTPQSVSRLLTDLHRATWWLAASESRARTSGALVDDAPYRDLGHLMRCLLNDARMLLAACPGPAPNVPAYYEARLAGSPVLAHLDDDQDEAAELWWQAAHELAQVHDWFSGAVSAGDGDDWADLLFVPEAEVELYSDRFRTAVETVRRDGDTHAWLPVTATRGAESRPYWLVNVWGAPGSDIHGLSGGLAADRSVILPDAGDWSAIFAARARDAAEQAGVTVVWQIAR